MQFQKQVVYIGHKEMTLKDGTKLYSITFYVDDESITVNVPALNVAAWTIFPVLSFGDKCLATFTLRKSDKLYRLSLSDLADV